MSAQDRREYRNLSKLLVQTEERQTLLEILVARGVGFKEEEEYFWHEANKLKGGTNKLELRKELIVKTMKRKLKDNLITKERVQKSKNRCRGRIEMALGPKSRACRWFMKDVKENCKKTRRELKEKYRKKVWFLVRKYRQNGSSIEDLNKEDKKKYGGARVFSKNCKMKAERDSKPVIVCREGEELIVCEDEKEC